MLIISFDFGTKNIGVAIGQKITRTASLLNTVNVKNGIPNWKKIEILLKIWRPIKAIIGLPLNMNGTKQKILKKTQLFAKELKKKFNISVEMYDERLSTVEAKDKLFQKGGYKYLKKNKVHSMSALIILESWMNN